MMSDEFRFYAFISHSSADARWGRLVQRKLEGYRLPVTLCSEHGWSRKPMKPVFFAPTDIQPGDLSEELKARLQASKNLIVIASPRSAQSEWVAKEIAYFHSLPQGNNIFFFIVDGQPMSGDPQTECYNHVIQRLGMGEPLGVNIHEHVFRSPWLNRERAYIQLITKLLGIEFDDLWQRNRRRQRLQMTMWSTCISMVCLISAYLIYANGNTEVRLTLVESTPHNEWLEPRRDAVVRMWIDGEERRDTLKSETNNTVLFSQIPRQLLGQKVRVAFESYDFISIDTTMDLSENMTIPYCRDSNLFGHVEFTLTDSHGTPLKGMHVKVGNLPTVSDIDGIVRVDIPIKQQQPRYIIASDIPMLDSIITMPCGGSGLIVKTK